MNRPHPSGRQFINLPGPTNIPDRILRAMDRPTEDFNGPEFEELATGCYADLKRILKTDGTVLCWASSGHGAWESSIVNTLKAGDRIIIPETGAFSTWWSEMAGLFGVEVISPPGDWRSGADPNAIEDLLRKDTAGKIRAVGIVHSETSTGVLSDVAGVRRAMDAARHNAMLMVDTISSLASMDYRMDEWRVDVTVGGSQKGLMLPTGLGIVGLSERAIEAAREGGSPRRYWSWQRMLDLGGALPKFPGTTPTQIFSGMRVSLDMLFREGLENVFARHHRLADLVRGAVESWGFEINARNPAERSDTVTAVRWPEGHDPDEYRKTLRDRFNVVVSHGLLELAGKIIRIGHLGDLNEAMVLGTLGAMEANLVADDIPHRSGGVQAAVARAAAAQ